MKPDLPISALVLASAELGHKVWAVQLDAKVHTYATDKIAHGVARRYFDEGRKVLGVFEYTASEVRAAEANWRRGQLEGAN